MRVERTKIARVDCPRSNLDESGQRMRCYLAHGGLLCFEPEGAEEEAVVQGFAAAIERGLKRRKVSRSPPAAGTPRYGTQHQGDIPDASSPEGTTMKASG